jgi:hypothetical protein
MVESARLLCTAVASAPLSTQLTVSPNSTSHDHANRTTRDHAKDEHMGL